MPDISWELQCQFPILRIAGVDEVGRGCIAGPVVACAAVLPREVDANLQACPAFVREVRDSKKLTESKREELSQLLSDWLSDYALGWASAEEVDFHNIHHATLLAMTRAVEGLRYRPDHVLVDGKWVPTPYRQMGTAIVKGDDRSLSIACASILAKVARDQYMAAQETQYPGYGLKQHKGYPTPVHLRAVQSLGVSPLHRKTFGPVQAVLLSQV